MKFFACKLCGNKFGTSGSKALYCYDCKLEVITKRNTKYQRENREEKEMIKIIQNWMQIGLITSFEQMERCLSRMTSSKQNPYI